MTLTVIQQFKGCTPNMVAIIFSAIRVMVILQKATILIKLQRKANGCTTTTEAMKHNK